MDDNFHYYVTYTAARISQFNSEDATTIARAALYVDYSDETCQSVKTIAWNNMTFFSANEKKEIVKIANIWPVFHFLPGRPGILLDLLKENLAHSEDEFIKNARDLICMPNNVLMEVLVDDVRDLYQQNWNVNRQEVLIRIGITMHVLADTFAHQGFCGLPVKAINEVTEVAVKNDDKFETVNWSAGKSIFNRRKYAPAGPSDTSFGYLGHGRMGDIPDEPGLTFRYPPQWRKAVDDDQGLIVRDNPLEFSYAFAQMINAMSFVNGSGQRQTGFSSKIDENRLDAILGAPTVQNCTNALINAKTDPDLKATWVGMYGAPADYVDPANDANFVKDFDKQAKSHRKIVIDNCPALEDVIKHLS